MPELSTASRMEAITNVIQTTLDKAGKASAESLNSFREIGICLSEAKELLSHGEYLPWAAREFQFSKQWCARLTSLAKNWTDYEQAQVWAEGEGHLPHGGDYSVDGALGLIRKWRKAINPKPEGSQDKPKKQTPAEMKAELKELQAKLSAVTAENEILKAELAQISRQDLPTLRNSPLNESALHKPDLPDMREDGEGIDRAMSSSEAGKVSKVQSTGLFPEMPQEVEHPLSETVAVACLAATGEVISRTPAFQ